MFTCRARRVIFIRKRMGVRFTIIKCNNREFKRNATCRDALAMKRFARGAVKQTFRGYVKRAITNVCGLYVNLYRNDLNTRRDILYLLRIGF